MLHACLARRARICHALYGLSLKRCAHQAPRLHRNFTDGRRCFGGKVDEQSFGSALVAGKLYILYIYMVPSKWHGA